VVSDFPWPITNEELLLNNVREAAANLFVQAYNQGIRDADVFAHDALKALRDGNARAQPRGS
jgi:hypothetical protein